MEILKKLENAKSKKIKHTTKTTQDYNTLCDSLREGNYKFDIKPGKGSSVDFIITTKWQKK